MIGKRLTIINDSADKWDTWLASRLSGVVHRSAKKGVVYFFSGNLESLFQLGYIRHNTPIHTVAVLPNTDVMLDLMAAADTAGSALPDQVIILSQDDDPELPEVVQRVNHWQFRNADYLVYIGPNIPVEIVELGFPIVHINPERKEVLWLINGKSIPFN